MIKIKLGKDEYQIYSNEFTYWVIVFFVLIASFTFKAVNYSDLLTPAMFLMVAHGYFKNLPLIIKKNGKVV